MPPKRFPCKNICFGDYRNEWIHLCIKKFAVKLVFWKLKFHIWFTWYLHKFSKVNAKLFESWRPVICFHDRENKHICTHSLLVCMCFRFQLITFGNRSLIRRYTLLNWKFLSIKKMSFMHIIHFTAMLPVSKTHEILQIYRGHQWLTL